MGRSNKIPETSFREEKRIYKAKIKEQAKEIKKLLKKIKALESQLEGKPTVKHKIKVDKKKETVDVVDKAKLLKDELRKRYSGYKKDKQ